MTSYVSLMADDNIRARILPEALLDFQHGSILEGKISFTDSKGIRLKSRDGLYEWFVPWTALGLVEIRNPVESVPRPDKTQGVQP